MPNRFLLAACQSGGGELAGRGGEWMGLAPALLWTGAGVVIATAWPVLDHPVTAEIDQQIIDGMTTAPDVLAALSEIQLGWLDRWRRTGRATSAELAGGSGLFADDHAPPLLWAPYLAMGFHDA